MLNSVYTGVGKFVGDCKELKNYSTMKRGEFLKKVTSLALRVLASATVVAGIGAFTAASAMICGVHSLRAFFSLLGSLTVKSLAISAIGFSILIPADILCKMALNQSSKISNS